MSWDSQLAAFEKVMSEFGRLDYAYPIAGINERVFVPNDPSAKGFVKPDLQVLEADLNGLLYTVGLALQQMRRQDEDSSGYRGKSEYGQSERLNGDADCDKSVWSHPSAVSIACQPFQSTQLPSSK